MTNGHEYTVRHRQPFLERLANEGWTVVGVAPEGSPAQATFAELGYRAATTSLSRSGMNPAAELNSIRSILTCYRRERPDIAVHATVKPVVYGTIAARMRRIPVLNLITGLGFAFSGKSPRARISRAVIATLYRVAFRHPNLRVVFQNLDDRDELVRLTGLKEDQCVVIPGSGVDVERFSPAIRGEAATDDKVVVLVGRMLYDKGVAHFVEAAKVLRSDFPRARFVLVGPSDEHNPTGIPRAVLEQWVARGEVEWWGPVADVRDAYKEATIVALPSRGEGMPKVILEAAACGIPSITTDVPGCRESIIDGVTGLLVPYGDSGALANGLAKLLENNDLCTQLGRNARKLAEERFAAPMIAAALTDTMTELM